MSRNSIFCFLGAALPALYFGKAGLSSLVAMAFLISFVVVVHDVISKKIPVSSFVGFNKVGVFLMLFLISSFLSSLFGVLPEYNISKWYQVLGVSFAGWVIYLAVKDVGVASLQVFVSSVYWSLGLISALALIDHVHLLPSLTEFIHGKELRYTKLTKFSSSVATSLPFAIFYALNSDKRCLWLVPFVAVVVCFAVGGRSGWLAFAVSAFVLLVIFPWRAYTNQKLLRFCFLICSVLGSFLGLLIYRANLIKFRPEGAFINRITMSSEAGAGSGRLPIWDFAIQRFLENPVVGIGIKGFRKLDFSDVVLSSSMHPHNAALEVLLETGVVGFVFALLFILSVCVPLFKLVKLSNDVDIYLKGVGCCALVSFVAYSTSSMVLTSIFYAYWLVYLVVLVVLMMVIRRIVLSKLEVRDTL